MCEKEPRRTKKELRKLQTYFTYLDRHNHVHFLSKMLDYKEYCAKFTIYHKLIFGKCILAALIILTIYHIFGSEY